MSYLDTIHEFEPNYDEADLSVTMANETFDRPDWVVEGLRVTEVGSRAILIVEGERALMHPIFAAAQKVLDELKSRERPAPPRAGRPRVRG